MAVIIEEMKMPENCGSCDFNHGYRCTRTKTVIDRDFEYQERLSDCPLHEVKTELFCEDTISRKDALQALCKAVHKNDDTIPCPNQIVSCLWDKTRVQDYAEEILKLPSIQEQRWISVNEKLPENNDNVLAWNGRCSMVASYDTADDEWYSLDDRFVSRRPIKYWIPLPQEPKEVEK